MIGFLVKSLNVILPEVEFWHVLSEPNLIEVERIEILQLISKLEKSIDGCVTFGCLERHLCYKVILKRARAIQF